MERPSPSTSPIYPQISFPRNSFLLLLDGFPRLDVSPFGQALRPFIENLFGPSKLQHQPAPSRSQERRSGVVEIFQAEEIDQALKQQRAAVLYFTQESCGPCRFIKPKYEDYIQHCCAQGRGIYGAIVDIANPQLYPYFKRYGLRGTPSFLYFLNGDLVCPPLLR